MILLKAISNLVHCVIASCLLPPKFQTFLFSDIYHDLPHYRLSMSFPSFRLSSISPTLLNSSARTLYRASWADVVATGWTAVFLSLSLYFVLYIPYLVFLLLKYVVHFEQKLLERWTPADFLSSNLLNWPYTLIATRCHCIVKHPFLAVLRFSNYIVFSVPVAAGWCFAALQCTGFKLHHQQTVIAVLERTNNGVKW